MKEMLSQDSFPLTDCEIEKRRQEKLQEGWNCNFLHFEQRLPIGLVVSVYIKPSKHINLSSTSKNENFTRTQF